MKKMVKSEIYHDGEYYCGRCLDFDVFTQGKTLDELVYNLKERPPNPSTEVRLLEPPLLLRFIEGAVTCAFPCQIMGTDKTHKIMDVPFCTLSAKNSLDYRSRFRMIFGLEVVK